MLDGVGWIRHSEAEVATVLRAPHTPPLRHVEGQHDPSPQKVISWQMELVTRRRTTETATSGSGLGGVPGKWHQRWPECIVNNPDASQINVYKWGFSLMDEFGLSKLWVHPYKN